MSSRDPEAIILPAVEDPRGPAVPTRPTTGTVIATTWGQAVHDAVFGTGVWYDVREGWYLADIAAGVADGTVMPRFGLNSSHTQLLAGLAGRVIGLIWRVTAAPSAGSIRVQVRTGGVTSPDVQAINASSGTSGVMTLATPQTFSPGTQINPVYGSDAGLTPTTVDLGCGLVVAYNYVP